MAAFGATTTAPVGAMRRKPVTSPSSAFGGRVAPVTKAIPVAPAMRAPPPVARGIEQTGGTYQASGGALAARQNAAAATDAMGVAPDRRSIAADTLSLARDQTQEQYEGDINTALRVAAAGGRLGAGMTEENVLDVARKRERDLDQVSRDVSLQAASAEQSDRAMQAQQATMLAQLLGSEERGDAGLTLERGKLDSDNTNQAEGRSLARELKKMDLAFGASEGAADRGLRSSLSAAEMGSRERISGNELASRWQDNAAERTLRQMLQREQLGSNATESAFERSLRTQLQGADIASRDSNNAADRTLQQLLSGNTIAANERMSGNEIGSRERMSGAELAQRTTDSAADRALRALLSRDDIGSRERMQGQDITARTADNVANREAMSMDRIIQLLSGVGVGKDFDWSKLFGSRTGPTAPGGGPNGGGGTTGGTTGEVPGL